MAKRTARHAVRAAEEEAAASRPFVTWTRGGDGGSKGAISIDTSGHYFARSVQAHSLGWGPEVTGDFPPEEMAQLQRELAAVDWKRGSIGTCPHGECEVIVVRLGAQANTMSLDSYLRQSTSWPSFPARPAFDHLKDLYERSGEGEQAEVVEPVAGRTQ